MNDKELMAYAEKVVSFYDAEKKVFSSEGETFITENIPAVEDQEKVLALTNELITAAVKKTTSAESPVEEASPAEDVVEAEAPLIES